MEFSHQQEPFPKSKLINGSKQTILYSNPITLLQGPNNLVSPSTSRLVDRPYQLHIEPQTT